LSGEVKDPAPWDEAKTPKMPQPPPVGSRFSRMSDADLIEHVRKSCTGHSDSCRAPGGALYNLDQLLILRTSELRALSKYVGDSTRRRWLEVLATPAAIVFATLMVLLYWHLHR
jgi:hypothetical protein